MEDTKVEMKEEQEQEMPKKKTKKKAKKKSKAQEASEVLEKKDDAPIAYKKTCKNKFYIQGQEIGEHFELTDEHLNNEKFLKRFNYACEIGMICQK